MRRGFISNAIVVLVVLALAGVAFTFLKDMDGPTVAVSPDKGRISPQTVLSITMEDPSGIGALRVGVRKDGVTHVFYERTFSEHVNKRTELIPVKGAQLSDGALELEIKATDASLAGFGRGNTRTVIMPLRLDTQPPRLSIKTPPANVRRGGAAIIRYTADEEVTDTGILIGNYFVPAYPQKDGAYLCVYPYPYRMSAKEFKNAVQITAKDLAGNVTRMHLAVLAVERPFRNDKIQVTDPFLARVQNKLGHLVPDAPTPLASYLAINKNERAANMEKLRKLSANTASAPLWDGVFKPLPRSAARAGFADHRSLFYNGQLVGEADHLGLDLASLRQDNIPAANNGRVIYADDLGIYGNLTLIDHGLGVMSLYSHMTDIAVKPGDVVKKGDIIGHTGDTGLAFGDHLHFGILVGGLEVSPVEWIDPKWMRQVARAISGDTAQAQPQKAGQQTGQPTGQGTPARQPQAEQLAKPEQQKAGKKTR